MPKHHELIVHAPALNVQFRNCTGKAAYRSKPHHAWHFAVPALIQKMEWSAIP
jgi:hypothetical protein